jgi:hypothetical protein
LIPFKFQLEKVGFSFIPTYSVKKDENQTRRLFILQFLEIESVISGFDRIQQSKKKTSWAEQSHTRDFL